MLHLFPVYCTACTLRASEFVGDPKYHALGVLVCPGLGGLANVLEWPLGLRDDSSVALGSENGDGPNLEASPEGHKILHTFGVQVGDSARAFVAEVVAAIVGYGTNWVGVKMCLRPAWASLQWGARMK